MLVTISYSYGRGSTCAYLCYHDVLIFFSAVHERTTFYSIRQSEPDKVTTNNISVRLRQADTERHQPVVDGFDHGTVSLAVRRLQLFFHVTLQLTGLQSLSQYVGCELTGVAT